MIRTGSVLSREIEIRERVHANMNLGVLRNIADDADGDIGCPKGHVTLISSRQCLF